MKTDNIIVVQLFPKDFEGEEYLEQHLIWLSSQKDSYADFSQFWQKASSFLDEGQLEEISIELFQSEVKDLISCLKEPIDVDLSQIDKAYKMIDLTSLEAVWAAENTASYIVLQWFTTA